MTLKECKELMLEMWWWLYEHPEKRKKDFLDTHPAYPQDMLEWCAACEYTRLEPTCSRCPVDWWGAKRCNSSLIGIIDAHKQASYTLRELYRPLTPYMAWERAKLGSRARKFAALEVVKCILKMKV